MITWAAVSVLLVAIGGQTFWISRGLSAVEEQIRELRADVKSLRDDELRDLGERVARLEERTGV